MHSQRIERENENRSLEANGAQVFKGEDRKSIVNFILTSQTVQNDKKDANRRKKHHTAFESCESSTRVLAFEVATSSNVEFISVLDMRFAIMIDVSSNQKKKAPCLHPPNSHCNRTNVSDVIYFHWI